jgi:hypothetical protein
MILSKFKRDTFVSIWFCSFHTYYGNHRAYYDCFKRKPVHIKAHIYQSQGYIFWVKCCGQIEIMSITLSKTCVYDRFIKHTLVLSRFKKGPVGD